MNILVGALLGLLVAAVLLLGIPSLVTQKLPRVIRISTAKAIRDDLAARLRAGEIRWLSDAYEEYHERVGALWFVLPTDYNQTLYRAARDGTVKRFEDLL